MEGWAGADGVQAGGDEGGETDLLLLLPPPSLAGRPSYQDLRETRVPAGCRKQEKLEGRENVMISTLVPSLYLFSMLMVDCITSSWYHVYLASLLGSGRWFGNFNLTTVTTTDHHFYISISIFLQCPLLLSLYDLSVNANIQDLLNQNEIKRSQRKPTTLIAHISQSVNCLKSLN